MGNPRACVSSRTIRYRSGCSCSVTGFDREVAIAILSENQYIAKLNPSASTSAMTIPFVPQIEPTATNRPPSAAIRIHVFILLMPVMCASLAGDKPQPTFSRLSHPVSFVPGWEENSQEPLMSVAAEGSAGDHAGEC